MILHLFFADFIRVQKIIPKNWIFNRSINSLKWWALQLILIISADENITLEKEAGLDLVVCADDPELLEKLDCAAEKGKLEKKFIKKKCCFLNYVS